jgi:dynein heavy chain
MISKKPLDIVLFEYAQLHLLRIHRVLKMSRGNSLLIGLGGSGR